MAYAYSIPGWLDGVKIRRTCWLKSTGFIYFDDNTWVDEDGETISDDIVAYLFYKDDWEVYEEPKKKVTRWLWTCKRGVSLSSFAANPLELSAREYGNDELVSLKDIEDTWVKLEWSRTEFDS